MQPNTSDNNLDNLMAISRENKRINETVDQRQKNDMLSKNNTFDSERQNM